MIISLLRFSSFIAPTKTSSAFILFLSKDTVTSRPDNFDDKTWLSAPILFNRFFCFPVVSFFGVSFFSSFSVFPSWEDCSSLEVSFLSLFFETSLLSFLSSGAFSSLGASFLSLSFETSFLSPEGFSSFTLSFFKSSSKIVFIFWRFSLLGYTVNKSLILVNHKTLISCSLFLSALASDIIWFKNSLAFIEFQSTFSPIASPSVLSSFAGSTGFFVGFSTDLSIVFGATSFNSSGLLVPAKFFPSIIGLFKCPSVSLCLVSTAGLILLSCA